MNKGSYIIAGTLVLLFVAGLALFALNANEVPMGGLFNQGDIAADTVQVHKDIKYGNRERNTLDLYIPPVLDKEKEQGVVLYLHGGSWTSGDKSSMAGDCLAFAEKGYITATMNYSFIGKSGDEVIDFTTMMTEIATALSTIKGYAAAQGINVGKVALSGYSAGAHLAMLYGYSMMEQSPLPVVLVQSKAGPADFSTFSLTSDDAKEFLGKIGFGGASPEEISKSEQFIALVRAVSPVSYIHQGAPTTLLSYGKADTLVVWENVNSLVNAFAAADVDYKLIEYPNSGHGLDKDPDSMQRTNEAMAEYLASCFGY